MKYGPALKKAKSAIQKWARMRDADENGIIRCCCCGAWKNWKHSDGAHYIPATYRATCFIEMNIHACCVSCNRFKEGARVEYHDFMIKKYGQDAVDRLNAQKHLIVKHHAFELEALAILYAEKQKEFSWKRL